jgi:hypothetical protein
MLIGGFVAWRVLRSRRPLADQEADEIGEEPLES